MKKLILVANTDLPTIESAIQKCIEKIKNDTGMEALTYEVMFGRVNYPPRALRARFVVFLGVSAFKTNQDVVHADSVGIMLDSPMNLGCVSGANVVPFDYVEKSDGYGFFFRPKDVMELAKLLYKSYNEEHSESVTVASLDNVPNILRAVKDTTTFAKDLAALNYSLRNEITKHNVLKATFAWLMSSDGVDALQTKLVTIVGFKSAAITKLLSVFDPENHKGSHHSVAVATNLRRALREVLSVSSSKKKNVAIPYEKIAEKYSVSPYDLKYATYLSKKNLLLKDVKSSDVHKSNSKDRFEGIASDEEVME